MELVVAVEVGGSRVLNLQIPKAAEHREPRLQIASREGRNCSKTLSASWTRSGTASDAWRSGGDLARAHLAEAVGLLSHRRASLGEVGCAVAPSPISGQPTKAIGAQKISALVMKHSADHSGVRRDLPARLTHFRAEDSDAASARRAALKNPLMQLPANRIDAFSTQQPDCLHAHVLVGQTITSIDPSIGTVPSGRLPRGQRAGTLTRS
jgi:hypothetical protein